MKTIEYKVTPGAIRACRSVLASLWEVYCKDNFKTEVKIGGIYDLTDEEVVNWLFNILEDNNTLDAMYSEKTGSWKPCLR